MRILVIRFSSLGDCVLLCPVLAGLKAAGAEEVTVVTKTPYAELFSAAEGVDRVVAFDPATGLRGLLAIGRRHRGTGRTVIDAHNTWRSRILSAALGGADRRLPKHYPERLGLIVLKRPARLPTVLARYAAVAGVETPRPGGLRLPDAVASRVAASWPFGEERPVAIAPGSRWDTKRWPRAHFARLARRLVDAGRPVVLVGDAHDAGVTRAVSQGLGSRCLDLAGRVSVLETGAVLVRCDALVGNDSGLMHLAEALGVPVVALFGPTVETFGYFPSLPASAAIERRLPCRPCSRNGRTPCLKRTRECLRAIPVEAVDDALRGVLAGEGGRVVLS